MQKLLKKDTDFSALAMQCLYWIDNMEFELIKTDSKTKARAGLMKLKHGVVETPIFMPVGTSNG